MRHVLDIFVAIFLIAAAVLIAANLLVFLGRRRDRARLKGAAIAVSLADAVVISRLVFLCCTREPRWYAAAGWILLGLAAAGLLTGLLIRPQRGWRLAVLCGCTAAAVAVLWAVGTAPRERFLGSYTEEKTWSYDRKYYAVQTVVQSGSQPVRMARTTVYLAETDEPADWFDMERAYDFIGICWERDSYNIWCQSNDVGIFCFEYTGSGWQRNEDLTPPDYIISPHDERYKDKPELWDTIYKSPVD